MTTVNASVPAHLPKADPAVLTELKDDYLAYLNFGLTQLRLTSLARINISKAPGPDRAGLDIVPIVPYGMGPMPLGGPKLTFFAQMTTTRNQSVINFTGRMP